MGSYCISHIFFQIKEKQLQDQAHIDARSQLELLKSQQQTAENELRLKEDRIQHLLQEMQNLVSEIKFISCQYHLNNFTGR